MTKIAVHLQTQKEFDKFFELTNFEILQLKDNTWYNCFEASSWDYKKQDSCFSMVTKLVTSLSLLKAMNYDIMSYTDFMDHWNKDVQITELVTFKKL